MYLQRAWDKYGEAAFEFSVIDRCEREAVVALEDEYLQAFNPAYNMAPSASGGREPGFQHSPETKAKIREAALASGHVRIGNTSPRSAETRAKMAAAKLGKPGNHTGHAHTAKTRLCIALAKLGNTCASGGRTPEQVERIRQGQLDRRVTYSGRP